MFFIQMYINCVNSKEDSLLEELLNLTNNHDNYQHSTPTTLSLTSM